MRKSGLSTTEALTAQLRLPRDVFDELAIPGGVLSEPQPGKGNAVRRAFLDVDAEFFLLADADMTYPADEAHLLLEPLESGVADMVVGDRQTGGHYGRENKRPMHFAGNRLVVRLVNSMFKADLKDIMSGYRAMTRAFVKTYPVMVSGFEIETDVTIHALENRMRIVELPITYVDRPEGTFSKLNTIRDGRRIIVTIFRIARHVRPLAFFSILSLFFSLSGFVAAIPVFDDWIQYRYIKHVPLSILATGLQIVAMLLIAIGLILDSIAHNEKRGFEMRLLGVGRETRGLRL